MYPLAAAEGRTSTESRSPPRTRSNAILHDGSAINVDIGSYLAQHDVIYQSPALDGAQGMPLGDGDIGGMLWCPGQLQLQLQKTDLWNDPDDDAPLSDWRLDTAGSVSIRSEPSFLEAPTRYEQRLRLHSGVITIEAENPHGACQITAFASASAGVIAIRYRDQSVRGAERRVDIHLDRGAHLFARGETVGILQGMRDRRYALLARIAGATARTSTNGSRSCSLTMDSARSTDFTLYVAVATSPRNGDPVAVARSRIDSAIYRGFDRLLAEQRQHWSQFWEKSFLRLTGADDDPLPGYLENLWYLSLYQQACCSRGFDGPLANGGLLLSREDHRCGPAVYVGSDLRTLLANLIRTNHLELSVPYVDTYFRLLPELAARTASEYGVAGARIPAQFNRFGQELPSAPAPQNGAHGTTDPETEIRSACEGLDTALLIWEAWRHAPDPFFLRERAYPLLRACAVFAIERCRPVPEIWEDDRLRSRVVAALRALLWADAEYLMDEEHRPEWRLIVERLHGASRHTPTEMQPFGPLAPLETIGALRSAIARVSQQPSGLFGDDPSSPDLAYSARLCSAMTSMVLSDRPLPIADGPGEIRPSASDLGFGGAALAAIEAFSGLPANWSAAFSLAAPGGIRISAEAAEGRARYVAVTSLLGGVVQIVNPWGFGERARVLVGGMAMFDTVARVIEIVMEPHTTYLIERAASPIARTVRVRLGGKPNRAPKEYGANRLGLPAPVGSVSPATRLPPPIEVKAVVSGASRIEHARRKRREEYEAD